MPHESFGNVDACGVVAVQDSDDGPLTLLLPLVLPSLVESLGVVSSSPHAAIHSVAPSAIPRAIVEAAVRRAGPQNGQRASVACTQRPQLSQLHIDIRPGIHGDGARRARQASISGEHFHDVCELRR
jgi:hypothetical protein